MIRKSFLDKYNIKYDESVKKGQDYDMWERCSEYGHLVVMSETLLFYRIHKKQISSQCNDEQLQTAEKVMRRRLARIKIVPSDNEFEAHLALKGNAAKSNLKAVEAWAQKLVEANKIYNVADVANFSSNVKNRVNQYKLKNRELGIFDLPYIFTFMTSRIKMKIKLFLANK